VPRDSGLLKRTVSVSGVPTPSSTSPLPEQGDIALPDQIQALTHIPELQLIYDTAPIGLAFLSCDCRYLQINQRLTEICGISVADHIGRSVRDTVPAVAQQVEAIVQTILRTGEPITGVEVNGQRPDGSNAQRFWVTYWHPVKNKDGSIAGINVAAEEITERKHAQAALVASEARFRELADNMSQFAWTADPSGRRTWFNKRWHDYAGTMPEEMEGWGWQKLHHPDHVDRVLRRMRAGYESGMPWEDTFPLRGRDGNFRWFLTRVVPIHDEGGKVVKWFGTNTDVTEQVELEKALRDLNENLEQRVAAQARERDRIWTVAQDLLAVTDTSGKLISVNPAWTVTLGWSADDLLGTDGARLVHPDDLERGLRELALLTQGHKTQHFESRLRHKSGTYCWLSWQATLDQDRIYAVGRDITDLKRAQEQLRGVRRELAQVSRQTTIAAMTASIAHEINQPLAAIVANANAGLRWLARPQANIEEVEAILKRIVNDGHRASDVIASTRAMFQKGQRERTPVDINALIGEVLALLHGELESHRVLLQINLHDALPEVMAERVQLQQVLLNLIMNAVDAMSSVADRERRLTIRSEQHVSDDVSIAVEDSGAGIDPDHTDRIFEAFFTTKPHGMGMGLSICRSIIEAHGGKLWAAPRSPHGTVFHVQLPRSDGNG
jgi:PAS domain S-box-containing protein